MKLAQWYQTWPKSIRFLIAGIAFPFTLTFMLVVMIPVGVLAWIILALQDKYEEFK